MWVYLYGHLGSRGLLGFMAAWSFMAWGLGFRVHHGLQGVGMPHAARVACRRGGTMKRVCDWTNFWVSASLPIGPKVVPFGDYLIEF